MIRKLSLTLLLILAGLGVMHLTIGFENFARGGEAAGGGSGEPIKESAVPSHGVVVGGAKSGEPGAVTVRLGGSVGFERKRETLLPNGDRLFLPVYTLTAEDSETLEEDLMRLERVRVDFFEHDDSGDEPRAVQFGTMIARRALVQVGRNENGDASIQEDRDMDLLDVVFRTDEDAAVRDLELSVARVRVRQTDAGIRFYTPDPAERFELHLGGDDPMELRGEGLRGFVPERKGGDERTLRLRVGSNPELVHRDATLSASGSLDYREDIGTGSGRIEVDDQVRFEGLLRSDAGGRTSATGDRLVARLLRLPRQGRPGRAGSKPAAVWRALRLVGTPAELVTGTARVTGEVLVGEPALDGEPYRFTAAGSPRLVDAESGAVFEAERLIHLVRLPRLLGAIERAFGLPHAGGYGELAHDLILFDGASSVVDERRGVKLRASDGLRLLWGSSAVDAPRMVVAHGDVHVDTDELGATSNLGFELIQQGQRMRLRLGPREPHPRHAFRLQQHGDSGSGTGAGPAPLLVASGHGLCTVEQAREGLVQVRLDSPLEDVEITQADGTIRAVRSLSARVEDRVLRSFEARGTACEITRNVSAAAGAPDAGTPTADTPSQDAPDADSAVRGRAEVVRSDDGRSFTLESSSGTPVSLVRGAGETLHGARIDVHRLDDDAVVVVAFGSPNGPRARLSAELRPVEGPAREGALAVRRVELVADRAFFVPRHGIDPQRLAGIGVPSLPPGELLVLALDDAAGAGADTAADDASGVVDSAGSRYLLADGAVDLDLFAATGERVATAKGATFYLRESDRAGFLRGPGAAIEHAPGAARRIAAWAPLIRFAIASGDDLRLALVPDADDPSVVELRDDDGERDNPFRHLRVVCAGPVESTGATVRFRGPLRARGLDERGQIDPDGVDMTAGEMVLVRDPERGAVRTVTATGRPRLRVRGIVVEGDEVHVLVPSHRCDVVARTGKASVRLDSFASIGDRFRVNYKTQQVQAWNPWLLREPTAASTGSAPLGPKQSR